jgi:hypothetical protein
VTLSVGSPKQFCALVFGRLRNSGVRVPAGLPILMRACHLRWHDDDLGKTGESLRQSPLFARPHARDCREQFLVPLIAVAPSYGVRTAGDFFKLIQRAAQISNATHPKLRHLRSEMTQLSKEVETLETTRLASENTAPASLLECETETANFITDRPDEQPTREGLNSFKWQSWVVSFASHKGPAAADKLENQDAVLVKRVSASLVFALCDGVSTSYGARYGAARAVATFCSHLCQQLTAQQRTSDRRDLSQILGMAASHTQDNLSVFLEALLKDDANSDWRLLRSGSPVQRSVERKLCENTCAPQTGRSWAPVLATTLIGGVIQHSADGAEVHVLRLGDGVIEVIDGAAPVESLLAMNSKETAIDSVLCPGPKGQASVKAVQVANRMIARGQSLVISSDGLIRGIEGTVSDGLMLRDGQSRVAADILRDASDRANQHNSQTTASDLYADNLSLIYMRHDEGAGDVPGMVDTGGRAVPGRQDHSNASK